MPGLGQTLHRGRGLDAGNRTLHLGTMNRRLHAGGVHMLVIVTIGRLLAVGCMRSRLNKTRCTMRGCFRLAAQSEACYTGENGKLKGVVIYIYYLVCCCYEWLRFTRLTQMKRTNKIKLHHFFEISFSGYPERCMSEQEAIAE